MAVALVVLVFLLHLRLRPKVMTISTMGAGLLPLRWAQGAGAEIMRRVAAPMVGGLAASAFLTLVPSARDLVQDGKDFRHRTPGSRNCFS